MSRVTSTARTVLQDLVERRLWPVAVLLLAAVLAVPVLMGGGGEPAPATGAPAGGSAAKAAVADGEGAQVTVFESTPPKRKRSGQARNPFVQAAVAATAGATVSSGQTAASAPSGDSGSSGPAAPSSGAGSTITTFSKGADTGATGAGGAGSQPTGSQPETSTPATRRVAANDPRNDVFRVDLRFGAGPGAMKTAKDVARLTPLPSAKDPVLVFLGVMKDAKTVVLLLPAGARGEGGGTCRPKAGDCRLLEVAKGQTHVVDVPAADGATRQFVVRVTGVKRSEAKTDAEAAAAHAQASKAGQALLREAAEAAGDDAFDAYRFRPELGTLARAARKPRAAGTGARTVTRPGEVVVWRTRSAQKH